MKEFKSFFKEVKGNEGNKCHYPTRLDTYGCGCQHDCSYCVDGDADILMYDGSRKKMKDVCIGDELYGVSPEGKYTKSIVLNKWQVEKPSYKIILSDGTELICSSNHRWLTSDGWKYTKGYSEVASSRPFLTPYDYILGLNSKGIVPYDGEQCDTSNKLRKVVSIEKYVDSQILFDITTSTENFVANNCVSHNCYAKSLLDFRKLWTPNDPSVADVAKIRRKIAKLPEGMPAIRLGGMTDCFQACEHDYGVTYETIKALNEKRQPYLIVTKSNIVGEDKYLDVMNKDLAHIQVTVTCTDDEMYRKMDFEKAPLPSKRIEAIERLHEAGFDVQLRLSPFVPAFVDYDVLANVKCDKILVEFLRVNTWINKWFGKYIDIDEYSVKQSGYRHLPLEKKIELISNIKGFSEITVCEDESEAYEYWQKRFNPNPDDCCNLRR